MPLYLLSEIEKRTNMSISELFDYFAGVSAGALICSLLLIKNEDGKQKYSANDIIEIFETQCKLIFNYTYLGWIKTGFGLFDSVYSSNNIQKSLQDYFNETLINDLIKPISIISYDLISNKPIFFNCQTFPNIKIKDCLMATTAAPTYFYPYKTQINEKDYMFIDGGVVSNNPIEQCFLDAYDFFNKDKIDEEIDNFYTLSLGTGYHDINYSSGNFGKIGWSSKIIDIFFNANTFEHNYELKLIDRFLRGNKLERVDFKLIKSINLDNIYSFSDMKKLMADWINNNDEKINDICKKLLTNKKILNEKFN